MTPREGQPLFDLGRVVATPGAAEVLGEGVTEWRLNAALHVARHHLGDWGAVPPEDARENDLSVREGFRILSSYAVGEDGARVWIVTEADLFDVPASPGGVLSPASDRLSPCPARDPTRSREGRFAA